MPMIGKKSSIRWWSVILQQQSRLLFRADAAFAKPEIYEYLETRQIDYAIRLPAKRSATEVLQRKIAHLLTRPTEGPSPKPIVSYHDFTYQAQSWNVSRMVVAKVEVAPGRTVSQSGLHSYQPQLSNYRDSPLLQRPRHGGAMDKRGKARPELDEVVLPQVRGQSVRLGLFIMAYNLGNFLRRLVLPESMKHWSLTSLQTRMIKTGGRLVRHARRLVFQLAEVLVSREMLCGILERNWPASAGSWLVHLRSIGIGYGYGSQKRFPRGDLGRRPAVWGF